MKALYGKQAIPHNIKKLVQRESDIRYNEIQAEIQKDITVQLIAAVLYTLNVCEGYGKKRLRRFFGELSGTFEDMSGIGFAGRFDTDDLTELVRERFGIHLAAEIKSVKCTAKEGTKNAT